MVIPRVTNLPANVPTCQRISNLVISTHIRPIIVRIWVR
jgi:hypothetical protein